MAAQLADEVQFIKGVGPRWSERLANLDIKTVADLLYYFPREYEDRSQITEIRFASPGQTATFKAKVIKIDYHQIRNNFDILKISFSDDTGVINGVWFNQSYLRDKFNEGEYYLLSGKISEKNWRKYKSKEINNPVYEKLTDQNSVLNTGRIVPVYPLTEGINQRRLRKVIANALKKYLPLVKEILPDYILEKHKFPDLKTAILGMHYPKNFTHQNRSRQRLAFQEFLIFQLYSLAEKKAMAAQTGIQHKYQGNQINQFLADLDFELTSAQKRVWQEIRQDMESNRIMTRLLQGDVGSGKTVIAALSLLETVANGYQGIFMAPTEILAEQHYLNFKELFSDFAINIELITGSLKAAARKEVESGIKDSTIDLIIGTHALFQDKLEYYNPGLVVIDEQHRFGVEQRHTLKEKGNNPDLLIMTATPIPRSMAMLLYGDLDLSIIDELPPGRKRIATFWRRKNRRKKIYQFLLTKLAAGRQIYIVCPLIEPSEELPDLKSAEELYQELVKGIFNDYQVALIHSSIKSAEKKEIMEKFRQGKIQVLIATTVIEVGVDVSNATIMVIENAERFGLAQLHQLRGRVGRGSKQSFCILISDAQGQEAKQRLDIMVKTNDGFKIAEADLELRGPGEFFGTRQHGIADLKVANLMTDHDLLAKSRQEAAALLDNNNWQNKYPRLAERVKKLEVKV